MALLKALRLAVFSLAAIACVAAASEGKEVLYSRTAQHHAGTAGTGRASAWGAFLATFRRHRASAQERELESFSDQQPGSWLLRTPPFRRVTSQGTQDGTLEYIFEHVGTTNKFYVEFGFDSADYSNGTGSNTYNLKAHHGWTGLLMDSGYANKSINLHKEMITAGNVVQLFRKHGVPIEPDYVSIDLDSTDLWVLHALLASSFRPRVVSVEYNCVYGADPIAATFPDDVDMRWEGAFDNVQGASLAAIEMVAREHGWSLATVVPEMDAVLVRDDLLLGVAKPRLADFQDRAGCLRLRHLPASRERAARLLDYRTFRMTGDEAEARAALPQQLALYGISHSLPGGRIRPTPGLILQPSSDLAG